MWGSAVLYLRPPELRHALGKQLSLTSRPWKKGGEKKKERICTSDEKGGEKRKKKNVTSNASIKMAGGSFPIEIGRKRKGAFPPKKKGKRVGDTRSSVR